MAADRLDDDDFKRLQTRKVTVDAAILRLVTSPNPTIKAAYPDESIGVFCLFTFVIMAKKCHCKQGLYQSNVDT